MADVFKDPGNSWWTTRRFQALVAVVLVLVAIWVVSLVPSFRQGYEADQFNSELELAARQLFVGYTQPIYEISQETGVICEHIRPGSDVPDCARFVSTIRESDSNLADTITQVETLVTNAPSGTSRPLLSQMGKILEILRSVHDSNQLLMEAWETRDKTKWQEGWALRESLAREIEELQDNATPVSR